MARRVTRAESVGLPAPSAEQLQESFATFRAGLAKSEQMVSEFIATGLYPDAKSLERGGPLREQAGYDDAVRQVGIDLAWTLLERGNAAQVQDVRDAFRAQLEKVVDERTAATANGWRYKGEKKVLAKREKFWEDAIRELCQWVGEV